MHTCACSRSFVVHGPAPRKNASCPSCGEKAPAIDWPDSALRPGADPGERFAMESDDAYWDRLSLCSMSSAQRTRLNQAKGAALDALGKELGRPRPIVKNRRK